MAFFLPAKESKTMLAEKSFDEEAEAFSSVMGDLANEGEKVKFSPVEDEDDDDDEELDETWEVQMGDEKSI